MARYTRVHVPTTATVLPKQYECSTPGNYRANAITFPVFFLLAEQVPTFAGGMTNGKQSASSLPTATPSASDAQVVQAARPHEAQDQLAMAVPPPHLVSSELPFRTQGAAQLLKGGALPARQNSTPGLRFEAPAAGYLFDRDGFPLWRPAKY